MISIVGAGPAGCLLGLLLARRGEQVRIFERRPDPRSAPAEAGRSINLALAARGMRALEAAGLMQAIEPLLVRMTGRLLHEIGKPDQHSPYGQRPDEVIWSVSRAALTAGLIDAARDRPNIELFFGQQCIGYGGEGRIQLRDAASGREYWANSPRTIGADGAGSALRHSLAQLHDLHVTESRLAHDYKELLIPLRAGAPALRRDALHIWPRGSHMLIALPNADGSFTATLFLPREGAANQAGFDQLESTADVQALFARDFPDVVPMIPDLAAQFSAHPQGMLGTIYCPQWNDGEHLLLIGDAAHAIVPFHGQGMNCAFEDCRILDELLASHGNEAFSAFAATRQEDCLAIAQMALENYGEMRDAVRDPLFQQRRDLALALEREYPGRFIPRYSMVMFHHEIPYSTALRRGRIQQQLLEDLITAGAAASSETAATLVSQRLPPIPAAVR